MTTGRINQITTMTASRLIPKDSPICPVRLWIRDPRVPCSRSLTASAPPERALAPTCTDVPYGIKRPTGCRVPIKSFLAWLVSFLPRESTNQLAWVQGNPLQDPKVPRRVLLALVLSISRQSPSIHTLKSAGKKDPPSTRIRGPTLPANH